MHNDAQILFMQPLRASLWMISHDGIHPSATFGTIFARCIISSENLKSDLSALNIIPTYVLGISNVSRSLERYNGLRLTENRSTTNKSPFVSNFKPRKRFDILRSFFETRWIFNDGHDPPLPLPARQISKGGRARYRATFDNVSRLDRVRVTTHHFRRNNEHELETGNFRRNRTDWSA